MFRTPSGHSGGQVRRYCPPCAETYQAGTYQLIRAGLAGGKGNARILAAHPRVFATFTAPSFGSARTRVIITRGAVARCRPRRKASVCPHGRLIMGWRAFETGRLLARNGPAPGWESLPGGAAGS